MFRGLFLTLLFATSLQSYSAQFVEQKKVEALSICNCMKVEVGRQPNSDCVKKEDTNECFTVYYANRERDTPKKIIYFGNQDGGDFAMIECTSQLSLAADLGANKANSIKMACLTLNKKICSSIKRGIKQAAFLEYKDLKPDEKARLKFQNYLSRFQADKSAKKFSPEWLEDTVVKSGTNMNDSMPGKELTRASELCVRIKEFDTQIPKKLESINTPAAQPNLPVKASGQSTGQK